MSLILQLDAHGQPEKWITWQLAAVYYAKGLVSWSLGENERTIRGGNNRLTGCQSIINTASIIAVKGVANAKRRHRAPSLSNRELFRRDHHMCAYCGNIFPDSKLTRDHIIPRSKNGKDIWTNVVTCCSKCNQKKDDLTLEQSGMTLLYMPYVPSKAEHLILANRNILLDQMQFLLSFVDSKSRVHLKKD